jgi:hypothetical protein
MFCAFNRKTGKIACAMIARDLAEAIGYRCFGVDSAIAWFPHAELAEQPNGVDDLRIVRNGDGVALVIA